MRITAARLGCHGRPGTTPRGGTLMVPHDRRPTVRLPVALCASGGHGLIVVRLHRMTTADRILWLLRMILLVLRVMVLLLVL